MSEFLTCRWPCIHILPIILIYPDWQAIQKHCSIGTRSSHNQWAPRQDSAIDCQDFEGHAAYTGAGYHKVSIGSRVDHDGRLVGRVDFLLGSVKMAWITFTSYGDGFGGCSLRRHRRNHFLLSLLWLLWLMYILKAIFICYCLRFILDYKREMSRYNFIT